MYFLDHSNQLFFINDVALLTSGTGITGAAQKALV